MHSFLKVTLHHFLCELEPAIGELKSLGLLIDVLLPFFILGLILGLNIYNENKDLIIIVCKTNGKFFKIEE